MALATLRLTYGLSFSISFTIREENPLIQAKDAILIDNTKLSKEEQFQLILKHS